MDISTRTTRTLVNEDQRWIGNGGKPIGTPRTIVLDRSLFDLTAAYPNGHIPSGIPLGKVTATGLYGPYDPAAVDGRGDAAGHLFASISVDRDSSGDLGAALFWSGEVITNFLPAAPAAQIDAAGRADVAAHIAYVTNTV